MSPYRCAQCGQTSDIVECSETDSENHCNVCGQPASLCACCGDCNEFPCVCTDDNDNDTYHDDDDDEQQDEYGNCTGPCCNGKKPGQGTSDEAPWVARGHNVTALVSTENWQKAWPEIDDTIDVCTVAADFYLLEAIDANVVNRMYAGNLIEIDHGPFVEYCVDTIYDAGVMLDKLVHKLAVTFRHYIHLAIGGELRHHRAIGGAKVLNRQNRAAAWVGWRTIYEAVGPEAINDAEKLFREKGWDSLYGGEKWAEACAVLYKYETGELPDRVFVDRVFDLQHNGGMLLNKIDWNVNNERGWNIQYVQSHVLPAHGQEPEPNWKLLYRVASEPVRELFSTHWDAMNQWRSDSIHTALRHPQPDTPILPLSVVNSRKMCRNCNSDPTRGHLWKCTAARYMMQKTSGFKKSLTTIVVDDDDFGLYNWKVWERPSYPIGPNGEIVDINAPLSLVIEYRMFKDENTLLKETLPVTLADVLDWTCDGRQLWTEKKLPVPDKVSQTQPSYDEYVSITATLYENDNPALSIASAYIEFSHHCKTNIYGDPISTKLELRSWMATYLPHIVELVQIEKSELAKAGT